MRLQVCEAHTFLIENHSLRNSERHKALGKAPEGLADAISAQSALGGQDRRASGLTGLAHLGFQRELGISGTS